MATAANARLRHGVIGLDDRQPVAGATDWQAPTSSGVGAPLAPPPQLSVVHSSPIVISNSSYKVGKLANLSFTSNTAFHLDYGAPASLDVAGKVSLTIDYPNQGVFGVLDNAPDGMFVIESTGVFHVTATGSGVAAYGFYGPSWSADITNNGLFTVSSTGDATGVEVWDPWVTIINTGALQVDADGFAIGLHPIVGGNGAETTTAVASNSGQITVTGGGGAVGVLLDMRTTFTNSGIIDVTGGDVAIGVSSIYNAPFDNSGTITAATTSPDFASVGLLIANPEFDNSGNLFTTSYFNSGVIEGDYAILVDLRSFAVQQASCEVIVNTGRINGVVSLGLGNDVVFNRGWMDGVTDLGDGEDTYDGAAEKQGNVVDGGVGNDRLIGGAYADVLLGGDDADAISAGAGDDFVDGGRGSDALDGGTGFDTLSYLDSTIRVVVSLAARTADAAGHDSIRNFERMIGSRFNDKITGSGGANVLEGNAGADIILGGGGDDVLIGGKGADTLTGGAGDDDFVFSKGDGADTITDFHAGGVVDQLQIHGYATYKSLVQVGADTRVVLSGGDSILLKNVLATSLTASDFLFDPKPLAPAPTASTLQTQVVDRWLAIGAGEVFQIVNPMDVGLGEDVIHDVGVAMISSIANAYPVLLNAGRLHVEADDATGSVTGVRAALQAFWPYVDNQASGVIEVLATGGADAFGIVSAHAVWNENRITVTSTTGAAKGGWEADFWINSGVMRVTGATQATGLDFQGSFWNSGQLLVSGSTASFGLLWDASNHPAAPAPTDIFVNSGTIRVTDTTAALDSCGISFSNFGTTPFWNSGVIEADYAIRHISYGDELLSAELVYNSGELRGRVNLEQGDAKLYNSGLITGRIDLGTGTDLYDGRTGTQLGGVYGGAGADTLLGGLGADLLDGGQDNDILSGGAGNDTLTGGTGRDVFRIEAGSGADQVTDFNVANERVEVVGYSGYLSLTQVGADALVTFSASDSILLKGVQASALTAANFLFSAAAIPPAPAMPAPPPAPTSPPLPPDVSAPMAVLGDDGGNTLNGVARDDYMQGNGGADHLNGMGGNDRIDGGAGDDLLLGGNGNDRLYGSEGSDQLDGGLGDDQLQGGAGADVFVYTAGQGHDAIFDFNLAEGDVIRLQGLNDPGMQPYTMQPNWFNVEIDMADGSVLIVDNASVADVEAALQVWATNGADQMNGTAQDNHYFALGGNDTLTGWQGNDYLDGGDGNDVIEGQDGADTLVGGAGSDTFVYTQAWHSGFQDQIDLITDLTDQDRIDLSAIDADETTAGDQAFALSNGFHHTARELYLSYDSASDITTLRGDTNGDGVADLVVRISGDHHGFVNFVL